MRRNIKGKTPAEHVFHVFLSLLHDAGNLDDPKLPPASSHRAMRAALALVFGQMTKVGAQREGGAQLGNLVVSNGRCLVAIRLADPLTLFKILANTAGVILAVASLQIVLVQCKFLPVELQTRWRQGVLLAATAFYSFFAIRLLV